MRKYVLLFFVTLMFSSLFAKENVDLLSFGYGRYSLFKHKHKTQEARVEYKFHQEWYTIRPMLGFMMTFKNAVYAYGGFSLDWVIKDHLIFSPNFAAGYYYDGDGRDLGFPLQFRSGIEFGWQFSNLWRMGVHFYHISNASLGKRNPGEESLVFFFSIPMSKRHLVKR